jgi:hypothetical protein
MSTRRRDEVHQLGLGEHAEAADSPFVPDTALVLGQLPPEPVAVLVERVQHREVVERRERPLVRTGDLLDVVVCRGPDHPAR